MFKVVKNRGKIVQAYQLGSDSEVIMELMKSGKIVDLGDGKYEVHSQETIKGENGGQIASVGDWIKVNANGFPYPNAKDFFEGNHRHLDKDTFEQVPKPIYAWNSSCDPCPEIDFLIESKGLKIDESSFEKRYSAELWGTQEIADADAIIIFYSISYGEKGNITDVDFNFVESGEFNRNYSLFSFQ